jgi:hypothetical protein
MNLKISVDAPIGFIWLVPFPHKLKKGVHPLPNTLIYPYHQNLKTMAEIHYNRDIIVHYLGKNLSEEQIKDMENLISISPNIKIVDFFSLDWEKYNFTFLYNDTNIELLDFLKMDNDDNLLGLRKDIAEHLLLLYYPKGVMFLDFDNKVFEPIFEALPTDIGLLCGWDTEMENRFNFYVNNAMVVSGPNNPVLERAFDELQNYLTLYGIDTDYVDKQIVLTSQNIKFKNLDNFTGKWKIVLLMCDFQCCSIVSELAEKFQLGAFSKELVEKAESTTAFKRVLTTINNFLSIESDGSRTWIIDDKYDSIFNNMYHIQQLPLKTEFRATINFHKPNPKPLDAHIIINSKAKFNMVEQFIKLNPNRKMYFYTFEWITVPKHFKHDVIVLKNYIYSSSVLRLAMVNILHEKGGICWAMQHNPVTLPKEVDERDSWCLPGCEGKLCGYQMCFDVMGVDRPRHKILCEAKYLIDQNYVKYGITPSLIQHLYLDSHQNYVEFTFNDSSQRTEKITDILLWYAISGYIISVQNYLKKLSFETLVTETLDYILVKS